jgi:hypothetical protein
VRRAEMRRKKCSLCGRRQIAANDDICRTCRQFISKYIETGLIPRRRIPMSSDVLLVMRELGVKQDRAVWLLGGVP